MKKPGAMYRLSSFGAYLPYLPRSVIHPAITASRLRLHADDQEKYQEFLEACSGFTSGHRW
jgi:hypothetical protein